MGLLSLEFSLPIEAVVRFLLDCFAALLVDLAAHLIFAPLVGWTLDFQVGLETGSDFVVVQLSGSMIARIDHWNQQ